MSSSSSSASFDAAERDRTQLLQQRAVQQLETLGDRQDLADAPGDFGGAFIGQLVGEILDRRGVGGDAEQARTRLVMQLVGDLAPLLLLHGDELAIEPAVFVARGVERAGERVEPLGDDGELLHLRQGKPRRVVTVFEAEHALRQMRERIEHAAEHDIKHGEDERIENEPDERKRGKIVPGLGDLVGRLADNDDRVHMRKRNDPDRAAGQLRAHQGRQTSAARSPLLFACGDNTVSWPIVSMNMMRTWRRFLR